MTEKPDLIDYPIFLVGAERSGTTLLRLRLDHHPQIAFNYEFEYFVDWVSDSGEYPSLVPYSVTPLIKLQLKLQDWMFRLQTRIKRFGLSLVLYDFLSCRFYLKQWQKQIKLNLNVLEISYLK